MALLFGNIEHGLSFFHLQKFKNVLWSFLYLEFFWNLCHIHVCVIYIEENYLILEIKLYYDRKRPHWAELQEDNLLFQLCQDLGDVLLIW